MARPTTPDAEKAIKCTYTLPPEIAARFNDSVSAYQRSKVVANLIANYLDNYFPLPNLAEAPNNSSLDPPSKE